jgi:NADH-quinone oxidoreductase subunit L
MPDAAHLGFALGHAWLILALPFFSFLVVGLAIRPISEKLAGLAATAVVFATAAVAYCIAWEYLSLPSDAGRPSFVAWSFDWLRFQENMTGRIGVLVDPISVLLMIVVTTISSLVHLYSIGYMRGETGYGRYFTWLNLFTFSMLGLVCATNLIQMYVFWELVGASSFLLIGFYYQKPSAVSASKKAFIVTRFADLGFLLGVLVLGYTGFQIYNKLQSKVITGAQPLDFAYLTNPEVLRQLSSIDYHFLGFGLLTVAVVLVFMGAAGKSAMFPLHIWLPDAMEGPTPVSALIHAATMVVAGVYLVARMFPVFAAAPDGLHVVMVIGAFTSLFAAVIGCAQDDIKRVLAFSTLSQLGYMMFALGVASMEKPLGYTASMFHLFTHAFFKALLFLGAGAMIHAVHNNEIWSMGGLRKKMPITHATFLIACLAIAGIWPFAGFFSKDEILVAALSGGHPGVFAVGMVVAALTAFYMFRIYFVSFWGQPRSEGAGHAHEVSPVMLVPLVVLAVLSAVAGFVPMGRFVSIGEPEHQGGIDLRIALPTMALAFISIAAAWAIYGGEKNRAEAFARRLGVIYTTIKNKFYIDEVYLFVTKKVIFRFVSQPIAWFDRRAVDGGVNLSAAITRLFGRELSRSQTGQVQTYGVWFVSGIIMMLLILWAVTI